MQGKKLISVLSVEFIFFVKDKDPWINLEGIKNCFDAMYDRDTVWPEDSLKALRERAN